MTEHPILANQKSQDVDSFLVMINTDPTIHHRLRQIVRALDERAKLHPTQTFVRGVVVNVRIEGHGVAQEVFMTLTRNSARGEISFDHRELGENDAPLVYEPLWFAFNQLNVLPLNIRVSLRTLITRVLQTPSLTTDYLAINIIAHEIIQQLGGTSHLALGNITIDERTCINTVFVVVKHRGFIDNTHHTCIYDYYIDPMLVIGAMTNPAVCQASFKLTLEKPPSVTADGTPVTFHRRANTDQVIRWCRIYEESPARFWKSYSPQFALIRSAILSSLPQ